MDSTAPKEYYCCVVHGSWSDWVTHGVCNASAGCGEGVQTLIRTCDNPSPEHGGDVCMGPDKTTRQCNLKECPADLNDCFNYPHCQF